MNLSVVVLIVVFTLIAVRKIGHVHISIWQAMTAGAVTVVASGEIRWFDAIAAIDFDVMLFLLGMFIIGQALAASSPPILF